MSVDKFGRHSDHMKIRGTKGPPGEGFELTNDGDYNMKNKKLCNVGNEVASNDAVNLAMLENQSTKYVGNSSIPGEKVWDAKSMQIRYVGEPKKETDASNTSFLRKCTINDVNTKSPLEWSCKKRRLVEVADPINGLDAVNQQTLKRTLNGCLRLTDKPLPTKEWDANNFVIKNVGTPKDESDAVNKGWIKRNTIEDTTDGWDCKKRKLVSVDDPVEDQDAVTKKFLMANTPIKNDRIYRYSLHQYRLSDVGYAMNGEDAVNLNCLKDVTIINRYNVWEAKYVGI